MNRIPARVRSGANLCVEKNQETTATPDFAAQSGKFKIQADSLKAQLSLLSAP
jgi:hypothetical protein